MILLNYSSRRVLAITVILAKGMPSVTPCTITSREVMRQHLAEIKRRGFAWDDEERIEDLRCMAAPIFSHDGAVIAAVSVVTFAMRTPWKQLLQLGEDTRLAAVGISRLLGHRIDSALVANESAGAARALIR